MAFESIHATLFPRRVTIQCNTGGAERVLLQIDATNSERISYDAQATAHEIEDGSEISDHVINKGRTLSLDGTISDTPINLATAMVGNVAGILGGALSGPAKTVATAAGVILGNRMVTDSARPSKSALDVFQEIYEKKAILTIISGLATHTNMIMEQFTPVRTARNAGALVFSARFREIRIVTGESVAVPKEAVSEDAQDLSSTEKDSGRQQPGALTDVQKKITESWAYKLFIK